jgi:hypothetical protein
MAGMARRTRLSKILRAGFMASSLPFVSTPAFAADGQIKGDLTELRRDISNDKASN